MNAKFKENTSTKKLNHGYSCECIYGLWKVFAPTKEEAKKEGYHYFVQYLEDGEYD